MFRTIGRGRRFPLAAAALALLAIPAIAPAQSPPSTFSANVSTSNETVTVDFTQHPIRSSNFQVLVQDSSGNLNNHTPAASRIYFGTVQGHPGARAAGLLKSGGTLLCRIYFESGVEWSSTGGTASVRGSTNWSPAWPTTLVPADGAGSTVYAAEVGVDSTYRQYLAANSNVNDTVEIAEFSVMASNLAYLRDAAILHRLGKVIVRSNQAQCPYETHGGDTGGLLNEVRNQWNNVLPVGSTHDLALVARPGAGGGLAWVGVIGTASRYSSNGTDANGDFSIIWRHEAGHNWGSSHYEGGGNPEGSTIMSNNSLSRFSSSELAKILAHRNTKLGILDNLGSYSFPLPPRANGDRAHFIVGQPVTIDVLANDSDSNGQSIGIHSFDNPTALGGTVALSAGTGPGGRDRLIYTPPPGLAAGTDHFKYRIADSAGDTAIGYVTLRPLFNDDLAAHWTLDDGSGATARETTSSQFHGAVAGGAGWTTGRIGGALTLDGSDDNVSAPPLDLNTNTVTISGWLRRHGAQAQWAGIGFCRGGGTSAGLNFGTSHELRYHWGAGSNPSYNFNSGLVVPDNTWTFVALVVSPAQATLYMKPAGGSLQSATATGTFSAQAFDADFHLGYDPNSGARRFKGDMDDFRVFRRALTSGEIASLAGENGTPSDPLPALGAVHLAGQTVTLSWASAPSSTGYAIYVGDSYTAVRDATTASPEYVGSSTSASFNTAALFAGTKFWRVDASDGTTVFKGPVWHFLMTGSGVLAERFDGIGGTTVAALKSAPAYPDNPNASWYLGAFDIGQNLGDNYGLRARGWLRAPATGNYTFWIASDDSGELSLGGSDDPASASVIASVNGYTSYQQWDKYPSQQSAGIPLQEGRYYYIEGLVKEGGGGDHLCIAWSGPGFGRTVIPAANLIPWSGSVLAAGHDSDGDGFPDRLELALGSDPYASASQPDPIYSGLHSWWRFDESSGAVASDTSGNQQPGAVGGATWTAGKEGNALSFDGNDTVYVGPDASLLGNTDFTLGAWVKVNPGSPLGTVIQQRDPGATGYQGEYMLNVNANGTVNFFVYNGGYQFDITTAATVNDGQWHYLTAIREGTNGYIYIDGVQAASGSGAVKALLQRSVSIGYDHRDSNKYFTGLIDDVRVYSRALSSAEIMFIVDPLALPPVWSHQDIGSVGVAGSATHSAGTYAVTGSGADIWNTADGFHYVHQALSGDGEITARVVSVQNTHTWAKAGVMIRESLTAGSRHAMIVVTPSEGVSFQRRASTGGTSTSTTTPGIVAPRWVRIVRSGGTLTAYHSADGSSWTQLGSQSIGMAANIHIGLAVTSHDNGVPCQAVFDNVSVTP